jgi:hypothetical protein
MRPSRPRLFTIIASFASLIAVARPASADEPISASEPRQLKETGEITTVIDAFDDDDPFDANLVLGFEHRWKNAKIRRETALTQPGLSTGGFVSANENVAAFSQQVSLLHLGADIGIFRDLALSVRLPLVLQDTRELTDLDGSAKNRERLQDSNGEQLFSVPFKSPNRSGLDHISLALNYGIFNQQRDPSKPSWVLGVEGQLGVGTPMHACTDKPNVGRPACPDPADPTNAAKDRGPGMSRATNALIVKTVFSRRFGYVEPYTGFTFLAEFAQNRSDFGPELRGAVVNALPMKGTFTIGTEIIPWERRDAFQRLVFDARFAGTYNSRGRDYSELFDALGASQAGSLRSANPSAYHLGPGGTSVVDPAAQKVFFTGITEQQDFVSMGLSGGVTWQAGEFIKFNAGLGFQYNQSHLITGTDSCNSSYTGDAAAAGPCRGAPQTSASGAPVPAKITGIPNPNNRPAIDLPGRRFSVDDAILMNLWINGIVMF